MKRALFVFSLLLPFILKGVDMKDFFSRLVEKEELYFYGLDHQPFHVGNYGKPEIARDVRITVINGILNDVDCCLKTVEILSATHGWTNVHYVYWNSEGWTADLYKGFFSIFGYLSQPARELAKLWQRLIEEMGGIDSDGVIYHYAHSIGASESALAATLLTEEEKRKIHIITFGPATIIPEEGFASVVNYISKRDAVSIFDPWNFFLAHKGSLPHAVIVGEFDSLHPLVEHSLFSDTYYNLILEHGQKFIDKYSFVNK